MGNVLEKSCRENGNTHFMFNNFFSRKSDRLWDNVEKYSGDLGATNDVTIWLIRVACSISKATCTYARAHARAPGYPLARTHAHAWTHRPVSNGPTCCFSTATMIRERASLLRYTYIARHVDIQDAAVCTSNVIVFHTILGIKDIQNGRAVCYLTLAR
jgi:hypothetical protein